MYAIYNPSIALFLGEPTIFGRKQAKGGTHAKPSNIPRLFSTPQHAKASLTWWLRGKVQKLVSDFGDYYNEDWQITPQPDRNPADWKVVEVKVILVQPPLL